MNWLRNLLSKIIASEAAVDKDDPGYIPTPKKKIPGAMHPLVAAKANRPQYRATGVGIVYDAKGVPKITKDWLDNLPAHELPGVHANLARHGWALNPDKTLSKLEK